MSQRLPPHTPPANYLDRRDPSSQKGGTLIAEDVTDLATHEQRWRMPDGYRPPRCLRCGHPHLHRHDVRLRVLRADPAAARITVVRYRCAAPACRARWLILPQFLARGVWRRWVVVAAAVLERRPATWPPVPARTRRRWRARLQLAGLVLVQVLAASGAVLEHAGHTLGLTATRRDVVHAVGTALGTSLGAALAMTAAFLHRLAPGLRLM